MDFFPVAHPLTAAALAARVGIPAKILGDDSRVVEGVAAVDRATPGALCFFSAGKGEKLPSLEQCSSQVIVCSGELDGLAEEATRRTLLLTEQPMLFFIECLHQLFPRPAQTGVAATASVHAKANLSPGAHIGHFALVDEGVQVGVGSVIESGARLLRGSVIGARVRVGCNTVVGADGLAFAQDAAGSYQPMPHLGRAVLENAVWIGANATVVRGILTDTVIGEGTKVGNHVNIGHNVKVGAHCFIAPSAVLCGSSVLAERVWIGPGAVIVNKMQVGAGAFVGAGAVVAKDVAPGVRVMGFPARPIPSV